MKRQGHSLPIRITVALCLLLTLIPGPGHALPQSPARRPQTRPVKSGATQPKLVLMIVVDQFRYDFLERFRDLFGAGGFRRLMSEGAFFINANYDYVPTYTAPGHAAIFTGSV
ncbi:MAG TPA: alkaline phosphatase family protein, partial [Blastocatellia bacterium]